MSVPKSQIVVLVTGITGFVGAQVALTFLQAGYQVRGVVRDQLKADLFKAKHSVFADRLSVRPIRRDCHITTSLMFKLQFVFVKDITRPGAFDEAVKGVDYFVHTASPLTRKATEVSVPRMIRFVRPA
jgi:nucleoside-diphosphate-sugar epimerase